MPGKLITTLFKKTDWTIADVNQQYYIGPDIGNGTLSQVPAQLGTFDLRQYREIHLYTYMNGLNGGTSPSLRLVTLGYGKPVAVNFANVTYAQGQPLSGTGQTGMATILTCDVAAISNSGVAGINAGPITVAYRPLFAQFLISVSGSPTSITTLETHIYGVE